MNHVVIAVDGMGGDHGASVVVPAALKAIADHHDLNIIVVGHAATLEQELAKHQLIDDGRLIIHHADEIVAMDEAPVSALRHKKHSSMRIVLDLVHSGAAHACVSAGNTGALMAMAHCVLKNIPGVKRSAIVSAFPSHTKPFWMLDLGANVDSSAQELTQFAIMGSILSAALDNIPKPKVYLLNIGVEAIKGNKQVKQTAQLLQDLPTVNYQGYLEGDSIYTSDADVIVCDGFVGNIALKTSEGTATFMADLIKQEFQRNAWTKLRGLVAKPALCAVMHKLDPSAYNGATFLGLQGVVIKSHGHANIKGFTNAINTAKNQVQKQVLSLISTEISGALAASSVR